MNLKYISRAYYGAGQTNGWIVRVPIVENGVVLSKHAINSKFFSDRDYRHEASVIAACKRYRNKYLKENNIYYLLTTNGRINCTHKKSSRNTSGVVGLGLITEVKNASGIYMCYRATWNKRINGKTVMFKKSFSYSDDGKRTMKQAFRMACAERYKHKGELTIVDEKVIPCFPDVPYKIKG